MDLELGTVTTMSMMISWISAHFTLALKYPRSVLAFFT
jgi:hypothetical protein